MKTLFISLLALLLFTQCTKQDLPITSRSNLNQVADISLNQIIELADPAEGTANKDKVRITFTELNDSRCPMNAFCIRSGSAVARFRLAQNQQQSKEIELVIGDALPTDTRKLRHRSADTILVAVGRNKYQLILKNVTPYPCTDCPNQETPKASIAVTAK